MIGACLSPLGRGIESAAFAQSGDKQGPSTSSHQRSVAAFGLVGRGSHAHSRTWTAWEDAYFPKKSSRGSTWGGGVRARYVFAPGRPFAVELDGGIDAISTRYEDSGGGVNVEAKYLATLTRFGANCLFPSFSIVRPVAGLGLGLGKLETELAILNARSTENNVVLDVYSQFLLRIEATNEVSIEPGIFLGLGDGILLSMGVGYAF